MRIVGNGRDWIVLAIWYGEERTVFKGSLWECLDFRAENK